MQATDTIESPTEEETLKAEEETLRTEALRRIKRKRDFVGHVVLYVLINAGLWIVWVADGAKTHDLWPAWVSGIWLVILLLDAYKVYKERPISDQQIQDEMRRIERRSAHPV